MIGRRVRLPGLLIVAIALGSVGTGVRPAEAESRQWSRITWHECEGTAPAQTGCTVTAQLTDFLHPDWEAPIVTILFDCWAGGERGEPTHEAWAVTNGFNGSMDMLVEGEYAGYVRADTECDGMNYRFPGGAYESDFSWGPGDMVTMTVTVDGVGPWRVGLGIHHPWIPYAPPDIEARRVAPKRGELRFQEAQANGAEISGYQARCKPRRGSGARSAQGSSTRLVVGSLRPDLPYRCSVRALSDRGPGAWSDPVPLRGG